MKYEVGDIYGYKYAIIRKPFNPKYPGASALNIYRTRKEAVIAAEWDLRMAFERGEKFNG